MLPVYVRALLALGDVSLVHVWSKRVRARVPANERARLRSPDVEPGPESLEVGLFRWDEIPWDAIAFPTVHWALDEYDKRRREHEFSPATNPEPEPPPPSGL